MRIQYSLVFQDGLLRLVVAERLLLEQQLKEDDSDGPDVHLVRDLR